MFRWGFESGGLGWGGVVGDGGVMVLGGGMVGWWGEGEGGRGCEKV